MGLLTEVLSAAGQVLAMGVGSVRDNIHELVQAEGQSLRRGAMKVLLAGMLFISGAGFIVLGFGLMLRGLYVAIEAATGVVGSSFIVGGISLLIAAILIVIARQMDR